MLRNLTLLELSLCPRVDDASLTELLPRLTRLAELRLRHNSESLSGCCLASAPGSLTALDLSHCRRLVPAVAAAVAALPRLQVCLSARAHRTAAQVP